MDSSEAHFTNRFPDIDSETADFLNQTYGSPLYIIDEPSVRRRLQAFHAAVSAQYPHSIVALSYKTNLLFRLLKTLHRDGAWAEVVSGEELEVARLLGVDDSQIIFNGPMKTDDELRDVIRSGIVLHCDHMDEVLRLEAIAAELGQKFALGIRVTFPRIGQWNRFGFEVVGAAGTGEACECAAYIARSKWLSLAGLHIQIGTNIRDLAQFEAASDCLRQFADELYDCYGIELQWIDLGGGLAGISPSIDETAVEVHPLPSVEAYAEAVIRPLRAYLDRCSRPVRLCFEPGRTLFEPFGATLTTVVGHRPSREAGIQGVIVDAGLNVLPSASAFKHPLVSLQDTADSVPTRLFGPSCRQRDVIRQSVNLPALSVGDKLLVQGTGGYTMAISHSFIRYRPAVVALSEDGSYSLVRKPDRLAHSSQLELY